MLERLIEVAAFGVLLHEIHLVRHEEVAVRAYHVGVAELYAQELALQVDPVVCLERTRVDLLEHQQLRCKPVVGEPHYGVLGGKQLLHEEEVVESKSNGELGLVLPLSEETVRVEVRYPRCVANCIRNHPACAHLK